MRVFDRAFGMRHHADDVARVVDDPGDLAVRPVDPLGITQRHAAFAFQPVERLRIGGIAPVMVRHGEGHAFACVIAAGERRLAVGDGQRDVAPDKADALVAQQRAGQEPRFGQHLKAVAHAQHHAAFARGLRHRLHDRRPRGHRARAQIIAV